MADISKAVAFMIQIANDDTHGYDQVNRNSPDYDCSSLVATALNKAGFNVSIYSWTGNLEEQLRACGFVDCERPWKAGDIHLNILNHVCMSINASQIAQASINELGTVSGGQTGDQTGKEIYIRDYYEYPSGWDLHLRYTGENKKESGNKTIDELANEVIAGYWGNGEDRKEMLTNNGYDYESVQERVDEILSGEQKKKKTNEDIAYEVIAGVWGNGQDRIDSLTEAGYDYNKIQKIVNRILEN